MGCGLPCFKTETAQAACGQLARLAGDRLSRADRMAKKGVSPAKRADDRVFLRRAYLDLIGRIPTPSERTAFLADDRLRKREALVDSLLAHPEFAPHMREMFDVLLLGRVDEGKTKRRADNRWHAYLETVFRENRPWNEFVRDIILAGLSLIHI